MMHEEKLKLYNPDVIYDQDLTNLRNVFPYFIYKEINDEEKKLVGFTTSSDEKFVQRMKLDRSLSVEPNKNFDPNNLSNLSYQLGLMQDAISILKNRESKKGEHKDGFS